jgi:hypothetical protein
VLRKVEAVLRTLEVEVLRLYEVLLEQPIHHRLGVGTLLELVLLREQVTLGGRYCVVLHKGVLVVRLLRGLSELLRGNPYLRGPHRLRRLLQGQALGDCDGDGRNRLALRKLAKDLVPVRARLERVLSRLQLGTLPAEPGLQLEERGVLDHPRLGKLVRHARERVSLHHRNLYRTTLRGVVATSYGRSVDKVDDTDDGDDQKKPDKQGPQVGTALAPPLRTGLPKRRQPMLQVIAVSPLATLVTPQTLSLNFRYSCNIRAAAR